MTDDPHRDRVQRATVFLLNQVRLLDTLFIPADEIQSGEKAVLLNADVMGSALATIYGSVRAADPHVAQLWLAETLRIFEAAVQGEHEPAFRLDPAALRKIQDDVLQWGRTLGGAVVPDALPDDI